MAGFLVRVSAQTTLSPRRLYLTLSLQEVGGLPLDMLKDMAKRLPQRMASASYATSVFMRHVRSDGPKARSEALGSEFVFRAKVDMDAGIAGRVRERTLRGIVQEASRPLDDAAVAGTGSFRSKQRLRQTKRYQKLLEQQQDQIEFAQLDLAARQRLSAVLELADLLDKWLVGLLLIYL